MLSRLSLFAVFMLGLTACGFHPVYGVSGSKAPSVVEAMNATDIENIKDEHGQFLRNALIDQMHTTEEQTARYRLSIYISAKKTDLGIKKDATATRAQLRLVARFKVIDTQTEAVIMSGQSRSLVSYNILDAQYGTLVNENSAYERGLTDISHDIVARLSAFYAAHP